MKTYNDYQISKTSQQGVYVAFKKNAASFNGVSFSHMFYFQYSYSNNDVNCVIDGKEASAFKPSFNENYYQANAKTGVVLSQDMEKFSFQSNSLGYVNYAPITVEGLAKLEYEN